MALTREQSIQKYGTEQYTAWGENEAQQDAAAKGLTAKKTTVTTPSASVTTPTATPSFNNASLNNIGNVTRTTQEATGGFGSVQDLINAGYGGYTGWGEAEALADFKATGGSGKKTGGNGNSGTPSINLTDEYNNLVDSSGISGLETNVNSIESQINQMTSEAADAKSKVNENPWISESSRIGRIAKIDEKLQNAIAPLQKDISNLNNQINTKQTEISNKLNLKTQQYNIDIAKDAANLSNFNSLLSSGALVNATAADIAALAQQTGLAPSFIQSAINAAKQSSNPVSTGTYTDAEGNLVVYTIDSTGKVINSTKVGKVQATSTGGSSATKSAEEQQNKETMIQDIQNGASLRQLISYYNAIGGLDVTDIYNLYNQYSSFGRATETLEDVKAGIFND